ncbi:MAG TPA: RagB/SusD family nutrient uptake outer membrane protein [Bacteroidales bacterium]|nr:RagB/SusD family nutrient uptake outer membrane protein [Bacteroidales bacterium]HRZ75779.1 RagB/SusD family nutrient uptake outer membrane protein [Bacteroidales bacterium]
MKTKYFYLIAFALVLALGSCTKLDEELFDKIPGDKYPENENQIANLSVDAYTKLKPFADDEGWWFLAQEISSDEFCGPTRGSDWDDGGKWRNMHRHQWTNDDEGVNRMWSSMWTGITTCNQVIDMMLGLPQNDAIRAKMSEVKVLRSFYYYLLIDNYGDAPYLTTTIGVPDKPSKVAREVIFDSLVATVTAALPALKPIDNKYMITRYAGFALLAKLYLNAEVYTGSPQWALAGQYTDSVLAGPYNLVNDVLSPFATANEANPEIIFSIPYDEDNFQGFRLHMRTLHYQHNLKYDMPVGPWNGLCIVPTHFDTYEAADIRRDAWNIYGPQFDTKGNQIIDGETFKPLVIDPHLPALYMQPPDFTPEQIRTTGARAGKYEIKKGAKENLSNDFPLFRISDFYLMKAETEIRQGRSGDEWINPIRQRAGVSTWSGATLVQLLAERGRELYLEGHRRQDLIRFGEWEKAWWEKDASSPERRTFPIPKWATDANPNLL